MEQDDATRKRACPSAISLPSDSDRLSALPDCLLHTIMSFMKARQVVQTCVLSTRWRHLWLSVPCLDVDFDEFKMAAHDDSDTEIFDGNYTEWDDFEDFAVNLMIRRSIAVLDSFRLHVGWGRVPCCGSEQAGKWICRAMKYSAPDPVIHQEGLSSGSWRLKRLHLGNVHLNHHFAKHVSSAFHTLEDLELDACFCEKIHSITSHSLQNLVLKNCGWGKLSEITSPTLKTLVIDGISNIHSCMLVILAPAVSYLHLAVNVYRFNGYISIANEMRSLARAFIHLRGGRGAVQESKLGRHQLMLLSSVSNVKSLELKGFRTMVLSEESVPFQEFKNLRNLLLDECDLTDDFLTLGLFLQNSTNLEKLTLRQCKFLNDSKKKKGAHKPSKPSSSLCQSLQDVQCENLKLTEIIYEDDDVHPLVELLLRISGKLPKNYIKLTKVEIRLLAVSGSTCSFRVETEYLRLRAAWPA